MQRHSEKTAREIDEEVSRIIEKSIDTVRHILELRRKALDAVAQRLIDVESIEGDELKKIIEENSSGPFIVPGTTEQSRRNTSKIVPDFSDGATSEGQV